MVKNGKYDFEKAVLLLNEAVDLNNKAKNIKDLQDAAEEERLYKLRIDGKNVMDVTEKIGNAVSSIHTETSIGKNHIRFDMMA